jgi:antigen flippase
MIGGVALTAGTRVLTTLMGFVTSVLTARYLGQAGRGDYFFIVTLTATIVQFANLGLPVSNAYLAASDRSLARRLVANSLWVSLAGGLAGAVVAVSVHAAGMLQDTPVTYLWLAAALAPASLFYLLGTNLLVGLERIQAFNAFELLSRTVVLAAIVAAGAAGAGAAGFVGASIAAWSVSALALGGLLVAGRRASLFFDLEAFARGFRFATKAYVITALGFLVLRSNVFLLRREHGPGELGIYSVAAQLGDVLAILPQSVALVLFPRLVRDERSRWEATRRAATAVAAVMLVACTLAAVLARPFIDLSFGAEFSGAARVLQLMLPGSLCLAVATVLSQYLASVGQPRSVVAVWAAAVALVVALSLLLIPGHAGAGAAVSLSCTYAALLAALVAIAWRYRRRQAGKPEAAPELEALPPAAE